MEFNFDQVKGVLQSLKAKGTDVGTAAAGKTRDAARIAKLTLDLGTERKNLDKTFLELGKSFYEESRDSATGLAAQLCAEVDAVNERIDALQSEIDALKDGLKSAAPADFEDVVAADEPEAEECCCAEAGETEE